MPLINRFKSACRYLAGASPPHQWRLHKDSCPNCGGKLFLSLAPNAFMTRCLSCLANVTNLSLIPVIQSHCRKHEVETAWEMSTFGATLEYLKRNMPRVYQSEFFENVPSGSFINGIRNEDVQSLSFADESLDLITSNQVFEHVVDDIQGFRECWRVLRPGGALIFSVPLHDIESTRQLAVVKNGEIEYLFSPEYHDSRHDGPGSVLCYWGHSFYDIVDRVSVVGFKAELIELRLPSSLEEQTYVIYAIKELEK